MYKTFFYSFIVFIVCSGLVYAQDADISDSSDIDINTLNAGEVATTSLESAIASSSAATILNQKPQDVPSDKSEEEETEAQAAIFDLFKARMVTEFSVFNAVAYWVQNAVIMGIPANTVVLILLTPIIATIISFVRIIVGLPTLELFVPIALAFALVSVGITLGLIILASIIVASLISKKLLRNVRMMFFPKRSLSMLFLSMAIFAGLTIAVFLEVEGVKTLSIFPVLILMLLGDSIVSIQLHKSFSETFVITGMTIMIGLLGFWMATSLSVQSALLLYPEIVLLTIPANLMIGRYFGLRFTELVRFKSIN